MKKRISVILCVLAIVISMFPARVMATDGYDDVKNVRISSKGILKWDDYKGALYYEVWANGYHLRDVGIGEEHKEFEEYLQYGCVPTGDYKPTVYAIDRDNQVLAKGTGGKAMAYFASGEAYQLENVQWIDDCHVGWDELDPDALYFVSMYDNGECIVDQLITDLTYINLYPYMIDVNGSYTVCVQGGMPGYGTRRGPEAWTGYMGGRWIHRFAGTNRYETALLAADEIDAFTAPEYPLTCVVIAGGDNFPDALSGAYLANDHHCPMVMINADKAKHVCDYLINSLTDDAIVYILGGESAVKEEWVKPLKTAKGKNYSFNRIAGANRYETNIKILKTPYPFDGELLVATGKGFADALSASATGLPLLLVGDKLQDFQIEYLKSLNNVNITIIGGESAVSKEVEKELRKIWPVNGRIAGSNRYDTSAQIAFKYFYYPDIDSYRSGVVLSTGKNFPDGLSGGPLAYIVLSAPLLLVNPESNNEDAVNYLEAAAVDEGFIMGGESAVPRAVSQNLLHYFIIERK